MTIVGRSKIDHPSLGTVGGSTLHAQIENIYTNIGNHLAGRYFAYSSIANSTVTTIEHNFGAQFADYKILLYTGSHPNLVRVSDPATAGWTIAATSGFEKTKIDVTAPSAGGPHTFVVFILQVPLGEYLLLSGGNIYANNSTNALKITQTGSGNALLVEDANSDTTPFVIDASGRLIKGASSAYNISTSATTTNYAAPVGIYGTSNDTTLMGFASYNTSNGDSVAGALSFNRSANATIGSHTIVTNAAKLGSIIFSGSDGTNFIPAAEVSATVDNTPGSNDMPGRLSFSTTADGTTTLTERMRIASDGLITFYNTNALKLPSGSAAQRPSGTNGMIRYNSDLLSFEGYSSGTWSSIGGGGTTDIVTQASHGFAVGDILYMNGATYTKAIATAANTAEVVGMVSRVVDSNTFEMTISGEVTGLSGLTAGEAYFLSPTTAGAMTVTEPTTLGQISLPLGVASSTTSFYVTLKRGNTIGGTNARTQISLLVNTTGNIQDVSAYDAGELTGWIYIDATTDLRFFVRAPFAKTGAGTNWNISPSYMGDTPPAGFSLSITSGGVIQYTMPSTAVIPGYSTGQINYALNAPAVGATFPLSVSGSNIVAGTPTVDSINEYTSTNGVQIKGRTSGTAIAAGYVGEKITWATPPSTAAIPTTLGDWTNANIVLTSGTWLVIANINVDAYAGAGVSSDAKVSITDSSNTIVQNQEKTIEHLNPSATTVSRIIACLSFSFVANLNTTTTYKIRSSRNNTTGSAANLYNSAASKANSEFFAIRIA